MEAGKAQRARGPVDLMPHTATNAGLHEFVAERVLSTYARPGVRAVDLGSGPGAMAMRLKAFGCEVLAVDLSAKGFEGDVEHRTVDLNRDDFAAVVGEKSFALVTAIEVIEHVENPIGFLRNVGRLLTPEGVAVITTPNVDSLPARVKFFLRGKIRTMDEHSDPTHISPIFFDLLRRQFLPLAGMRLREHLVFPPDGYQLTRQPLASALRALSGLMPGEALVGDNHVLVLQAGRQEP
jgi:SAM-dependent methyltransferase